MTPHLVIHSQEDLPPALHWQALSFKRMFWASAFQGEHRFDADWYPPGYEVLHFSIVEGENLISHCELVRLTFGLDDEVYQIYGLGAVMTFPPYRREGFARRVVEAATRHICTADVDLGLLFCRPELIPFYASCGWEAQSPEAVTVLGSTLRSEDVEMVRMTLFVSEKGKAAREAFLHAPLTIEWLW